jgi:hypothetical protein
VTGLLRRADGDLAVQRKFPIGILPLGRTNTVATSLFFDSDRVKMMAEATMAVIKEITKPIDVIKIEVLEVSILLQDLLALPLFYCFSYHFAYIADSKVNFCLCAVTKLLPQKVGIFTTYCLNALLSQNGSPNLL